MTNAFGKYYYAADRTCAGKAENDVLEIMAFSLARFPVMRNGGTYGCRVIAGTDVPSVHGEGRAGDIMTGTGLVTAESKFLAEQMRVFSLELGIQGIIHNHKMWFCNLSTEWKAYSGVNPHVNHIHYETFPGDQTTADRIKRVLTGPSVNGNMACPNLRLNDRGPVVKEVQYRLRGHGFALTPDSIYGVKTQTAVRVFQTLAGLSADGVCGPITRGRLR